MKASAGNPRVVALQEDRVPFPVKPETETVPAVFLGHVAARPRKFLDPGQRTVSVPRSGRIEVVCMPLTHRGRVVLVSGLAVGIAGAWVAMMIAAQRSLFLEPTDAAVAEAKSASSWGVAAAVAMMVLVFVTAALVGRAVLLLLGLPAALCAGWWLLAPDSAAGAVFLYGLGGSVVVFVVLAAKFASWAGGAGTSAGRSPKVGR